MTEWLETLAPSEQHVVAAAWGCPEPERLGAWMADAERVAATVSGLDPLARSALERLLIAGGAQPESVLAREFGAMRSHTGVVAPRAYLSALHGARSPLETLYITGLVWRRRGPDGAELFVPASFRELIPLAAPPPLEASPPPRAQVPGDPGAFERLLSELLALAQAKQLPINAHGGLERRGLALLAERMGLAAPHPTSEARWPEAALARQIAVAGELLSERDGLLRVTPLALAWLRDEPLARLGRLVAGWIDSDFDELSLVAGLRWRAQPLQRPGFAARRALLRHLSAWPEGWMRLDTFVEHLQAADPAYARPAGDFGTWQLQNSAGEVLNGWQRWRELDGALARAMISGPLHWLGIVDSSGTSSHARLSAWGLAWLQGQGPPVRTKARLRIRPPATIIAPEDLEPLARFQLSRIAEWEGIDDLGAVRYRLGPKHLDRASERGISVAQIQSFLEHWAGQSLPKGLQTALAAWERERGALKLRSAVLLEAADPSLLPGLAAERLGLPNAEALSERLWAFEAADGRLVAERLREAGHSLETQLSAVDQPLEARELRALWAAGRIVAALMPLGSDGGPSKRLLDRVWRLLPSEERLAATQQARLLAQALGVALAEEQDHA